MSTIYSVEEVTLAFERSLPPNLIVTAVGTVSTGGWSNFRLSKIEHVTPPEDGIQEFSFDGTPPSGIATQAFESHKMAFARLNEIDEDNYWGPGIRIAGIRVVANTNMIEVNLT